MGRVEELIADLSSLGTTSPRGPGSAMPTGGTTSTASPLLFPGLSSEVSSSSAVLVKAEFYSCQTPHCPVDTWLRELHVAGHIGYMR